MAYKTNSAPYQRTKKSTLQIMIELGIALAIVWIAAIVTTFVKLGANYGLRSILLMVVALVSTALCDVLTTVLKNKKDNTLGKKIVYDLVHNYSWITAMIFTLLCPVWTDYYVVIVGSIFATLIVKNLFGGFGSNIFNPAAFGRIFIQLCFDLSAPSGLVSGVDATTGATITGIFNSTQQWLGSQPIEGYSVIDVLLGNYFGTMGEPFTILLLVLGIVLAIRGVINWRAPVFYVGTVAISSLLIGLILGFDNPLLYLVYQLGLGGLMFGAVFMITDPVTTPTSPFGNCLVGIVAALLTMLIRVGTNGVEGVVYSIAIVNLISPSIDLFITGKTSERTGVKSGVTFGLSALSIATIITVSWFTNGGREVNSVNGIARAEYDDLVAATHFSFMDENGFTFGTYSKEISSDNLKENGRVKSQYAILDADLNEIGVVYCVTGDKVEIVTEPPYSQKKSCSFYIAFSVEDKSILGISLLETPNVGASYETKVKEGIEDFDYASNDILTMNPSDIVSGATYSATGIQNIIKIANDLFISQYGA